MPKILVVNDQPVAGAGAKAILDHSELDAEVSIASSADAAIAKLAGASYDLYLVDLHISGRSSLDLTRRIRSLDPSARIIIYADDDVLFLFNLFVEAGVSGFIRKSDPVDKFLRIIACVLEGDTILPIDVMRQLRRQDACIRIKSGTNHRPRDITFSTREQSVLYEAAMGRSNRQIAESLFLSQRTVEHCFTSIFEKLGVQNRSEAVLRGREWGVIPGCRITEENCP